MSIFSFIVVVVVVLLSSVLTGDLIAHYTWSVCIYAVCFIAGREVCFLSKRVHFSLDVSSPFFDTLLFVNVRQSVSCDRSE